MENMSSHKILSYKVSIVHDLINQLMIVETDNYHVFFYLVQYIYSQKNNFTYNKYLST